MTAALAGCVDTLDLAPAQGISPRAVRTVLKMMAKIANDSGEFRYGLRGSKLAALTDYSLSVVRRAQRYLVEQGYVERVEVGGGRASTRWRVVVHKLTGQPEMRHTSHGDEVQQMARRDTAQKHHPWLSLRMNRGGRSLKPNHPPAAVEVLNAAVCSHGGHGGRLPNGQPRCPLCRRDGTAQGRSRPLNQ